MKTKIYVEPKEKWQLLINIAFNNPKLIVNSVDGGIINFSGELQDVQDLHNRLQNADFLRSQVARAVKIVSTPEEEKKEEEQSILRTDEIVARLFDKDLQTLFELTPELLSENKYKFCPINQKFEFSISYRTERNLKKAEPDFQALKTIFRNKELIEAIILGKSHKISEKNLDALAEQSKEIEYYNQSIFDYKMDEKSKSINVTLSLGGILQSIQKDLKGTPVITSHENEFFISEDYLLEYLGKVYGTNLLFHHNKQDTLHAIVLSGADENDSLPIKNHYIFAVDCSGSMRDYFEEFKEKVKSIVAEIGKYNSEYSITFIPFNHEFKANNYAIEKLENLNKDIDLLKADGYTNLYDTFNECLKQANERHISDMNTCIIFWTDGIHCLVDENGYRLPDDSTGEGMVEEMRQTKKIFPQLTVFTVGTLIKTRDTFKALEQYGVQHIHINNPIDIDKLNKYIEGSSKEQIVFKLVIKAVEYYLQASKGGVSITEYSNINVGEIDSIEQLLDGSHSAQYSVPDFTTPKYGEYDIVGNKPDIFEGICSIL